MAQPTASTDRDLASIAEARALARRAKAGRARPGRALPGTDRRHRRRDGRGGHAAGRSARPARRRGNRLRRRRRQGPEEPVRLREGLRVHPADEDRRRRQPRSRIARSSRSPSRSASSRRSCPSTNPTSTAIYKILIAIKARCPIVISPHPSAARCITRVAEIMSERRRGAPALPDGAIGWMTDGHARGHAGADEGARDVAVILATGGMGLVRAAYSAGKPAYGVGPGNAPCYIERVRRSRQGRPRHRHRQDVRQRRALLVAELGRRGRAGRRRGASGSSQAQGALLPVGGRERRAGARCWSRRSGCRTRRSSASPATYIAEQAGISVPPARAC